MSNPVEIYDDARTQLSDTLATLGNARFGDKLSAVIVRRSLNKAQIALCKLRHLDGRLNGEPEPKRGD